MESLREKLAKEPELVIVFGDAMQGDGVRQVGRVWRFAGNSGTVCLPGRLLEFARRDRHAAYSGSRAAMNIEQMLARADLDALWVVGANPLEGGRNWRRTTRLSWFRRCF